METDLIDRIYECSFAPEFWPGVLDDIARIADARGGVMFAANLADRGILNWTASPILRDLTASFIASGLFARQQRLTEFLKRRYGGFLTEDQVYKSKEAMAAEPMYRDFLWPAGLGWCAATSITLPTGDILAMTFERDYVRGPPEPTSVDRLNELRPHLAAARCCRRGCSLERARAAAEALALIGLPALVFDHRGRVLAANNLIEALTGHIFWRTHDRISLKDAAADALLRQAIATLGAERAAQTRSFGLRGVDAGAAMVAHVIPIRRSARDIFQHSAGVLVLTPVTLPQAPPVELVQSLFDLTPAEARVARHLTTGQTVEEIAAGSGVSINTVRTQLRAVLAKTGCRRQAEAVALLGGIAAPRG